MYNGRKPDDPVYQREFYVVAGSPANKCAQEMAIRLAPARDSADLIAEAAVYACSDQAEKEGKALPPTGQSHEELVTIVKQVMKQVALLAVIPVRAGHCLDQNSN